MGSIRLILVLVLLSLLSVSFATFPRPWQDKSWVATNPNIWSYGMEYWWNLPEFDRTISSTNFEQLFDLQTSSTVRGYVDQAISYGDKSKKNKDDCTLDILVAVGSFSTSQLFLSAFLNSSDCRAYKRNWIKSVDYSLLALEESEKAAKNSMTSARSSYEQIKFIGLCNQSYSGPGSGNCNEASMAFITVDNNLPEGKYGQYALFSEYSKTIRVELAKPVPALSLSSSMLRLVWDQDGIISVFSNITLTKSPIFVLPFPLNVSRIFS